MTLSTRPLLLGLSVLLVALVAGFLGYRALGPTPTINAGPGTTREPLWFVADQNAEAALPRFDDTIQGIRIGPEVDLRDTGRSCPSDYTRGSFDEDARNSALNPIPDYLPPETTLSESLVVRCEGEIVGAEANYGVEGDRAAGRLGGLLLVYRFQGDPTFRFDAAAERVREISLGAGIPAVLFVPISPDGLGMSAIFVNESWGLTTVRATGLPESELIQVAESLLQAPITHDEEPPCLSTTTC